MDSKALESLMIPMDNLEITTEGLFDKLKEKKAQRRQHEIDCQNLLPKIETELKKIVSSYKPKYKNVKISPYYYTDKLDCSVGVELFNYNKLLDQDDSVIDSANNITDEIYELVVKFAKDNKYTGFTFKAEVPDNCCIDIKIL
nr:MAG TPA: hypothetical protein [Caudoviricetes sp.]